VGGPLVAVPKPELRQMVRVQMMLIDSASDHEFEGASFRIGSRGRHPGLVFVEPSSPEDSGENNDSGDGGHEGDD
jgi:hypothetical protein